MIEEAIEWLKSVSKEIWDIDLSEAVLEKNTLKYFNGCVNIDCSKKMESIIFSINDTPANTNAYKKENYYINPTHLLWSKDCDYNKSVLFYSKRKLIINIEAEFINNFLVPSSTNKTKVLFQISTTSTITGEGKKWFNYHTIIYTGNIFRIYHNNELDLQNLVTDHDLLMTYMMYGKIDEDSQNRYTAEMLTILSDQKYVHQTSAWTSSNMTTASFTFTI